ncbi:hypothetical protein PINS_up011396 [Pythium insidiosum]|nr:hypothetical protein PINS_up011396 [Pythium insidiosum]
MKLVALVSGGKDSCYAMMESVRVGHEIVCIAHLRPPLHLGDDDAEIDSFMFQSVGHNVVRMIAECMDVPLVEGTITGTAVTTDIDYSASAEGDEVEDLYRLLADVKQRYPEVEGVCSGAIFSSYQRNRVEHVCGRLGLTSLGYLWRRDQVELLGDMVDAGVDAILVKVAAIGLKPRRHLGRSIADLQPELLALKDQYQLNVCGEGGEYETLTLDCPLFKKRIVVDASHVVMHSDDLFAPVAFLVVDQCHLEDKDAVDPALLHRALPTPFVPSASTTIDRDTVPRTTAIALQTAATDCPQSIVPALASFRDQFYVSGLLCPAGASLSLEEEMDDVFAQLERLLSEQHMTMEDVCFVHLFVRDMREFARLNAAYCRHVGQFMPPSRSCVEVASLPTRVLLDCFALRGSGDAKRAQPRVQRDVLHVQSISAWAPNCIGPYSQANVLHKALILLAGQIALLPETMTLVGQSPDEQLTQSMRNAGRVLEALDSNLRHVVSTVVYCVAPSSVAEDGTDDGEQAMQLLATDARRLLTENAALRDELLNDDSDSESDCYDSDSDDEAHAAAQDARARKTEEQLAVATQLVRHAPVLVVEVSHLPRSALVEVELQALTHAARKSLAPSSTVVSVSRNASWFVETQVSRIARAMCHVVAAVMPKTQLSSPDVPSVVGDLLRAVEDCLVAADLPWDRVLHLRVFYLAHMFTSELQLGEAIRAALGADADERLPAVTFVPVTRMQTMSQAACLAVQVTAQDLDKMETDLWLQRQA